LGLDGAGGAAKPLLRAPKKPAPLHGRLPAFSGAVDAFERARKCFLEWRYFFSIILSEFLKNRVALQIVPALSAKVDNKEKRFIQVENSLLLSKQFHALSTGSRFLYFCMAMESGERKNFILPQKDAKKYGIAPSSLRKHINELEAARFIRVYSGKPTREPNRYEFCLSWKLPPSPLRSHTPMAICSKSVSDGNKGGP
jgi:hypothetical protein